MTIRLAPLAAVVLLAGCGTPQAADSGSGSDVVPDGSYLSTRVVDDGVATTLVPGTRVRITFSGDQVSLSAGCNTFTGTARWDGQRLTVRNLGGTEMGCRPPLDAQDSWLSGLFAAPVTVRNDGSGLVLTAGSTVVDFGPEGEPSVDLQGTRWLLDSLSGPGGDDAAVSSVPAGVRAWLEISDGVLRLDTGCNSGSGPVRVGTDTMEVGAVAITQMGCTGDRAEIERQVLAVVQGTVDFTVEDGRLTLTGSDGSRLGFRARGDFGDDSSAGTGTAALTGTGWRLTGIGTREGDVTSMQTLPDQADRIVSTLRLTQGRLLVNTGCNVGNAEATVSEDTLQVGPLMLSKRACKASEGTVEGAVVGLLESGAVRWSITGDELTLSTADQSLQLVYVVS